MCYLKIPRVGGAQNPAKLSQKKSRKYQKVKNGRKRRIWQLKKFRPYGNLKKLGLAVGQVKVASDILIQISTPRVHPKFVALLLSLYSGVY
jgi:hypothetical protein